MVLYAVHFDYPLLELSNFLEPLIYSRCEKAKRYERRAQELQERCRKGRGNRRREVHPGDFPSKYPGSAVLEVRDASFQFMEAVDVEAHDSGRCAEDEVSPGGHAGGRVGVEGFS